jgi:sarcosine oxidase subunit beta
MADWRNRAEVVIIGGGIIGASTAYHLARRGIKDVVIMEKDFLAQGSTGLSVGGIRQQFSHPANIHLSQESVRVFEHFQDEFGVDIWFCRAGYLFLARQAGTWREFLSSVEMQRRLNVPVEVLNPDEIRRRWPYLNCDDIIGGTFGPEDGYADPYLAAMGFAAAARKLGVRIEELTRVTAIRLSGDRVLGVETTRGPVSASAVVNAAGPLAAGVAAMVGLDLPVSPGRRQAFMTQPFDLLPRPVPMIIDQDALFYLRGAAPNIILGMSNLDEPSSFNLNVDREFMETVVEAAVHRVPILEKAKMLKGWAGLYEITPDDNPIIGEAPSLRGFFCAVGFSGHGFQHGPAVGRILSELISRGRTDFDLTPFSFDRFKKVAIKREKRVI